MSDSPMYLNGFPSLVSWLRHCSTTFDVHWFTLLCWYALPPIAPSMDYNIVEYKAYIIINMLSQLNNIHKAQKKNEKKKNYGNSTSSYMWHKHFSTNINSTSFNTWSSEKSKHCL